MANLCCTGVTECDHIVTIGYLKSFIGTDVHSSLNDTVLSVNSQDDTYCPTYAELTGGTLIQNHSNGATPNGDVDGIIVDGSYASNQIVMERDLSMVYTRFKSLSISASQTTISECGGNSTLSYTHLYTRYTKSHTDDCERTSTTEIEVSDTNNSEVSWNASPYGSVSYPTYTIGKNGTVSASSRSTTVTASVTFRGTNHTDTVVITQNALSGEYKYYTHSSELYSYDRYDISPSDFSCEGGTWNGTGYYTNHDWDVYRWVDSCGTAYNNITITRNDTYPSYSENYDSGEVGSIDCSTLREDYSHTETKSYHGLTSHWKQECKSCSGCVDYIAYTYTNQEVDCSVGSATVPYTYTAYTASVDSSGNCTYTEKDTGSGSYNVSWNCDTSGGWINEHVNVTGAPCCIICTCGDLSVGSTSETWEYNGTTSKNIAITSADCISSISVNSLEHFNVTLGSNKVTVSPKGENTSDSAYVENVRISYNADSTSCDKEIILTQKANSCTPSTCVCYKASQATLKGGTSIGSGDTSAEVEWTYTAITWTTNATCKITSAETTGTSSHTVTGIEVNNTCSDIVRSGSFTWTSHKACGSNNECTDNGSVINWSVTQDRGKSETDPECSGCYCSGFTIGSAPSAWNCNETNNKYVPYTADTCIANITASVNNSHFAVSVDTPNTRISVKPTSLNTTTSNITATVTVSFNSGVNTCESKTFLVVHNSGSSCSCSCSDLTVRGITNATSTTVASGAGNSNLASYTASCATIGQVTFSDSWITNIGVSNGYITGTVAANCSSTERSATLTIPYSAGSSTCTSKTVTIKQSAGGLTIVQDKEIDCHGGTVTFSV